MLRVPTRVHGMLDYAIGALLIALPFLGGFGQGPQTWVPVALGAGVIAYSLLTDYELGAVRRWSPGWRANPARRRWRWPPG